MKTTCLKVSSILLFVIPALGFVLTGCKKETPPPREPTAKEKQFLSAPDAVTCELEKIKISKLNLPDGPMASYIIREMEQLNRHYIKQGQITLAKRPFKIILGFHPEREFYIYDKEKGFSPSWSGSQSLYSYHKFDNKFYEFMLIENGTKIAARPYTGPLGIIKLGKGSRELEKIKFWGSLKKEDDVAVPVGTIKENQPDMVTECAIPVGDYSIDNLIVTYDNLLIRISNNPYPNEQKQFRPKDMVYSMQVRRDKPCVLDFSNEPKIMFIEPVSDKTTFKRGEKIKFAAVLLDPKLDILIRGLYDTSVQASKATPGNYTSYKTFDPNVVIARADGEVVAEGMLPFG